MVCDKKETQKEGPARPGCFNKEQIKGKKSKGIDTGPQNTNYMYLHR